MKVITFNYTKADKSNSERTLLVLTSPSNLYGGLDVSELDPVEAAEFTAEYTSVYEEYLNKIKELQAKYDLRHNYRQFKPEGMADVTEI